MSFDDRAISGLQLQVAKGSVKKFILVYLGKSPFAVPLGQVREVMGLTQLSPLPNMPPFFAGLINLRGKVISAIDLKKSLVALSLADRNFQSRRPCMVITEISERIFGAIVDDITEVVSVTDSEIAPAAELSELGHVFSGVIKSEKKPLAPILNLESALRLNELIHLPSIAS